MAEQGNSTAIVPAPNGSYQLEVKEFTAAGSSKSFAVAVPESVDSQSISVMLRAALLKRTSWKEFDFPTILHAVVYADRMGLDIMAGDVYIAAGGRISTTANAKIRHAIGTGRVVGYHVEMKEGPDVAIEYDGKNGKLKWAGKDLTAKVTVHVKGWTEPMVYEAKLSEWFVGTNPNWRMRPGYMLRKNALSKALEEVAPMGIEDDDAPPIPTAIAEGIAAAAAEAVANAAK